MEMDAGIYAGFVLVTTWQVGLGQMALNLSDVAPLDLQFATEAHRKTRNIH